MSAATRAGGAPGTPRASGGGPGGAPGSAGSLGPHAGGRDRYPLALGLIGVLEALTFLTASMLHLGTHLPLLGITGEKFPGAVIPEALIGIVMLAGSAVVLAAPRRAWGIALGTHVFAAAGTGVGISVVLGGAKAHPASDSIYHVTILAVLLAMVAVLARKRSRAALRPVPGGTATPPG
ncbi:MAG TPA: hypothetical protein VKY26_00345 [Actinomycetota bacterium]|nr:hypothetical protein [Actinomycetota bacterium]